MTVPMEYRTASRDFDAFMLELRDHAMLATTNQTYTMLEGVLQAFRRRLEVRQAIAFAGLLPPVLRAIFVSDWDVDAPVVPFACLEEMNREVLALRHNHNVSTATAIEDVTAILKRHVDSAALALFMAGLPAGAATFWGVEVPR